MPLGPRPSIVGPACCSGIGRHAEFLLIQSIARLTAPGHAVRRQHLASRPASQCGRSKRQATLQPGAPPNPDLSGNIHTHSHPPPRRKHQPAL